jgi:putative transcriptional regulator
MTTFANKIIVASQRASNEMRHAIIYIITDDEFGSVGVKLNFPTASGVTIETTETQYNNPVYFGGNDDIPHAYLIHSNDYRRHDTVYLNDDLNFSSGASILTHIANGHGPYLHAMFVGFCKWNVEELTAEIDDGQWVVSDFDFDYFFNLGHPKTQWKIAMQKIAEQRANAMLT